MPDTVEATWRIMLGGRTPHELYCLARDAAPDRAEAWRDEILDSYEREDDGEGGDMGGMCSLAVDSVDDLKDVLTALWPAAVDVHVEIIRTREARDIARAFASIPAKGIHKPYQFIDLAKAALNGALADAARRARDTLDEGLSGT